MSTTTKQRLQIDLSEADFAKVARHMDWCGSKTKTEHFNMVYTIFEEALQAVLSGRDIGIIDRATKSYEVMKFHSLEAARRHHGVKPFSEASPPKQR
jgi:hypothetical protein